jgi:hypothetical protein
MIAPGVFAASLALDVDRADIQTSFAALPEPPVTAKLSASPR